LTGEYETIVFSDDDSILNVKLQVECENSTGDLNGIQRDYPIVNKVSDDANSPPPEHPPRPSIMLHDDNNEADVENDGVPDNYGVSCDRTDDDNPPSLPPESNMPCIQSIIGEVNEEYLFWHPHRDEEDPIDSIHASTKEEHHEGSIGVLDGTLQDILNVEFDNCDGPSERKYQSSTEAVPITATPNSIEDLAGISNPSMIPNDGEKVVLFSSVSRVEMVKNEVMSGRLFRVEMVKNKVMSGRLFQSVYRVNSNINLNKRLQIVLPMFLQLVCE